MYSVSIAHSITEWIHLLAEIWKKKQSMELSFPHNSWKMWFPPIHLPYNGKLFPTNSKSLEFNFQRITGNSFPVEFGEFTQRPNSTGKILSKNSIDPFLKCDFHECISRILFFHGICGKWFSTVIFQ